MNMLENFPNLLGSDEYVSNYTEADITSMAKELRDSGARLEASHGLRYDEKACLEFFAAFRNSVDYTTILHPNGLYEVPLFVHDPVNELKGGFELDVKADENTALKLAQRGAFYASRYPNELFINSKLLSPLSRLETYLVGQRNSTLLTQEEGLEHEIRHLWFQRTVEQTIPFTRALDEAFALTTVGTAAAHENILDYARGTHGLEDIRFGFNMFLALRGLGRGEMDVLSWLNEQDLYDDVTYTSMPVSQIKQILMAHIGLNQDEMNEQASLVRQRARVIKTVFQYQVLQVYNASHAQIDTEQYKRKHLEELQRRYENYN